MIYLNIWAFKACFSAYQYSSSRVYTTPDYGVTYLFYDWELNCGEIFNDDERTS